MPSSHLTLCHPLLLLPPIFPSIRVFSNESVLHMRWPKYWSFSFTPRTDLFRMDWLDLLAVQGTLKSLLQHHSSNPSILWHSALFIVQLSHPYVTTGKTIALTRRTFVDEVMSLLFNMLSRFLVTFLPRSKCLLISWLQSPSAVILIKGEFPHSPVVRTNALTAGAQVQSLVRELRFCKPCSGLMKKENGTRLIASDASCEIVHAPAYRNRVSAYFEFGAHLDDLDDIEGLPSWLNG